MLTNININKERVAFLQQRVEVPQPALCGAPWRGPDYECRLPVVVQSLVTVHNDNVIVIAALCGVVAG